ncbi:hypothetical protein K474DRAFT_1671518 [Panus rudis PR-1116 ss-1]|nr:hypothetical protein K474DRAFT_1671518 [Panus rudis PR-1116 ss-1]
MSTRRPSIGVPTNTPTELTVEEYNELRRYIEGRVRRMEDFFKIWQANYTQFQAHMNQEKQQAANGQKSFAQLDTKAWGLKLRKFSDQAGELLDALHSLQAYIKESLVVDNGIWDKLGIMENALKEALIPLEGPQCSIRR